MSSEPLTVRLPATAASVPVLRGHVRAYARRVGLSTDEVADVELAVTEAATNAVVHAFVDRDPGTLELEARAEGHLLVVHVRDDGRGFGPRIDSPGLGLGVPTIGQVTAHVQLGSGPGGRGTEVEMHFASPAFLGPGPDGGDAALVRRLRGILGAVSEAVTVSAADGRMVFCNQEAAELLGAASPDELAGASGGELAARFRITTEDGEVVRAEDLPNRRVLAGERPLPLLTRSVHLASGRARWLLTTSRLLPDPSGPLAVNTILDVTRSTEAERRHRFLATASERLASSLDLDDTFAQIAALAVPTLADWCAVDVVEPDGRLRRVVLTHRDRELEQIGRDIDARHPPSPDEAAGPYVVLRTGEPLLLPEVDDATLRAVARDADHLADLRRFGIRSALMVPMAVRGTVMGVLSLIHADSRRVFGAADAALATDVAARAGVAIDTARRFRER